jgi:uncharacterized protein YkwD
MRRGIEFAIIFSTLLAIVSTLFLYQSRMIVPPQTASVIDTQESIIETVSSTSTEIVSTTPEQQPASEKTGIESLVEIESDIVIEKLPITEAEISLLKIRIHSLSNLSRSQNNLTPFSLDETLSSIAKMRSNEMIEKDYFSHASPTGCDVSCLIKDSGYQTLTWGENLALSNGYRSYTTPELAQTFISDWLKSSSHRDNILSKKLTHHGIGISAEGERIVVTVVFAAP